MFVVALVAAAPAIPAAQQTAKLRIEYTSVTSTGSGNWVIEATLHGDGRVEEVVRGVASTDVRTTSTQQKLGVRWRVVSDNRVQRVFEYPNHYHITDVEVSGRTCEASVSAVLKPDKTTYVVNTVKGKPYETARPNYVNVRCSIR